MHQHISIKPISKSLPPPYALTEKKKSLSFALQREFKPVSRHSNTQTSAPSVHKQICVTYSNTGETSGKARVKAVREMDCPVQAQARVSKGLWNHAEIGNFMSQYADPILTVDRKCFFSKRPIQQLETLSPLAFHDFYRHPRGGPSAQASRVDNKPREMTHEKWMSSPEGTWITE